MLILIKPISIPKKHPKENTAKSVFLTSSFSYPTVFTSFSMFSLSPTNVNVSHFLITVFFVIGIS